MDSTAEEEARGDLNSHRLATRCHLAGRKGREGEEGR